MRNWTGAAAAGWIALAAPPALAQDAEAEIAALRAQLETMEARLQQLETQQAELSARAEAAEARAATAEAARNDAARIAAIGAEAQPSVPRSASKDEDLKERGPLGLDRDDARLTISGQINQALLYASQGGRDQLFVADNDDSGSRIGFVAETDFGDWTSGVEVVVSAEVNSTDEIDFGETFPAADGGSALGDFRQAHWFIEHPTYGFLSIGQGDTAAEDIAFADLSGTAFVGAEADVGDIAGGLSFAGPDGPLDPDGDDDRLDNFFDMLDDSREVRAIYRSPDISGVSLAASISNETDETADGVQPALGLRFERSFGDWEAAARASWRREDPGGDDRDVVTASASVLAPSGVNLTLAAASGDAASGDLDRPYALFAKIGYRADLVSIGETAFSIDGWYGRNNPAFASPGGALPEATSVGLFAVQSIEALNTELYLGGRLYNLDGVHLDGEETTIDDLFALISGARVSF